MNTTSPRKGAVRMADIPPDVRAALNRGQAQTLTLAEFLAVDQAALLRVVSRELGLEVATPRLDGLGVMDRLKTLGAALAQALSKDRRRRSSERKLATHTSDIVRQWCAWATVACPEGLTIEQRLERAERFAADGNMGVREIAWMTVREAIAADVRGAVAALLPYARHGDANVRRFASESTRPRGVWCRHIDELKRQPQIGLPLLELVRSDESLYVRRSVANWLNDASKSQPAWVEQVTKRWLRESPSRETKWVVHHATRTMRKRS